MLKRYLPLVDMKCYCWDITLCCCYACIFFVIPAKAGIRRPFPLPYRIHPKSIKSLTNEMQYGLVIHRFSSKSSQHSGGHGNDRAESAFANRRQISDTFLICDHPGRSFCSANFLDQLRDALHLCHYSQPSDRSYLLHLGQVVYLLP
jgi:hypothetical protein